MALVFVGMPVYNSVPAVCMPKFVAFFLKTAKQYNALFDIVDSVGVELARNLITEHFLSTQATHLLFIDSDMLIPADLAEKLLSHDKDIVSVLYYGRTKPEPMFQVRKNGELQTIQFPKNSLIQADSVGLGACLIKRKVIEDLSQNPEPLFKTEFLSKTTIKSEDTFFCEKAKAAGFKIFIDTGLEVKHYGGFIDKQYYERK
jgi:hypothetical protein